MTLFHMGKFYIPEAWTGEQALAVQEFLEEIGTAIWNVHEKAILKAMNLEDPNRLTSATVPHFSNDDDDFLPF